MDIPYRLTEFNVYDDTKSNQNNDGHSSEKKQDEKEFIIQMFGINEKGKTCSIFVEGYNPFFYIKIDESWNNEKKIQFINDLKDSIKAEWEKEDEEGYYSNSITKSKIVERKKLYGFDGGKLHKFLRIEFKNTVAMNKVKNLWYYYKINKKTEEFERKLKPKGYHWQEKGEYLKLYEAHIPPLLRLFHIQNISPSGWITLPKKETTKHKARSKTTTCDFEYTINYKHIIPLPDKETLVPYNMCSFDIEASSSHGDFPLPKKDYKKLATNIIDIWNHIDEYEFDTSEDFLKDLILAAFDYVDFDDVDRIYSKNLPTEEILEKIIDNKILTCIPIAIKDENPIDSDNKKDQNINKYWNKAKKYNIIGILNDSTCIREEKINQTNKVLNKYLPAVKGDKVTFIGSTFLRYGEEKPYLNHCIVLDTCKIPSDIENCTIETYETEREVLLAWTKLIQRENPDLITGYNIFGFDYPFMFDRSVELECEEEFLKLSRNKDEVCAKKSRTTQEWKLEENSIVIASGQHDLKFIKMPGRLQVDMYNFFRRDYNLDSYKLDYVSGYFIGDMVKKFEYDSETQTTKVYSKNLTGLENGSYINFEEIGHSTDLYKEGQKFKVQNMNLKDSTFNIPGKEDPEMIKSMRWGLAKDDVTPQDIFRLTNEGPKERAIIAKYCIQDCNLVHHLIRKIDVMTGYIEMAKLCSVPMNFLVMRGQGIKLTSYVAKKCREKGTLLPTLEKPMFDNGYEGAIVLPPKCDLYLDKPVACVDYSSLYPSSMISDNISHDSKVWTKEYDLNGALINETGERDENGKFIYDNLEDYKYVDIKYDTYKWERKTPTSAAVKIKCGSKICRFAQFPDGKKACLPAILEELLAARKATRKEIPNQKDDFMKNVLDKRQISIKLTANSLYGQTGARTSSFYEVDVAASTTAIGRKLLTYAKRVIEETYDDVVLETKKHGKIRVKATYTYGDTDSIFFTFNVEDMEGNKIKGQKALEITIELAQEAGEMATKFLKKPHDLEYEKTFMPFCLLSKKRYVGMLYELDPNKCKRKSMGIVLKRRDNAPIVKDVYGGIIDILMKEQNIENAIKFLRQCLQDIINEKCGIKKLIISKSLRSNYKNPAQIAHKVLAERMGRRDPGNKPANGDRIPFIYIHTKNKKALQGERIEHPDYIKEQNLKINYSFYITNQIMKPVLQIFALVLEKIPEYKKRIPQLERQTRMLQRKHKDDEDKMNTKIQDLRNKEAKQILFDHYLRQTDNDNNGNQSVANFFTKI